ncbi:aminoglycoside phosphotransferase family protein [Iamia sp. SCSIO 61187]|uniref:phosphotransferase family protein n=1 Tax=Iamia sp. SCSIO 61187 TaxID=2722752 RepID=UPI001C62B86C|nr:aminoglycoside phosphotransferase family protein [Iamia sp. SCSIO 61187]QYG91023.1 aminoglycoside phosphotransferase family protein [Iamia sp. SCSIO 61187]
MGHSTIAIADTPDLLTAEWLTAALGPHLGGGRVTAAHASPVGTGQMCDSLRLALTYEGAPATAPASVVAKLPAADPTSRATALSLRSYEKEVRFYQQLAPDLPIRTPTVFHADIDPATASFVLLLEDMAPAQAGDQLAGCSPAVVASAIDELVHLHAPRWGDPTLAEMEWLHGDIEAGRAFLGMLLPNLWAGFKARYGDVLDPHVVPVGEDLFAHLGAYLTLTGSPLTITHGDYRLDNLLLDPDDGHVLGVVDWQTVAVGPALHDVAYVMGAGLLPEDRRPVEEELVRRYHDGLLAAGIDGFDWDTCWHEHRRGTFAGLVMAVAASMLVEQTERGDLMFLAMASRHAQHALDLDAVELLRSGTPG